MDRKQAIAELKAAGASHVQFGEEFPNIEGLGVEYHGHRYAVTWPHGSDRIAEAVAKLKLWMASVKSS